MVINELLLEVRKSIRLHKLLISVASHMGLSVIGCMSNRQCNCRSNSKWNLCPLLVQLFLNGMRIHVTNCFLFSQRELMLLRVKAQEFGMEVQCCNWHPAECQLCSASWIPMFVTQQKEPECMAKCSPAYHTYKQATQITYLFAWSFY